MGSFDFERFFDLSLDLLCIASTAGHFIRVNTAFQRQLGWSTQELTNKPFATLIHPDDREATAREVANLADGALSHGFQNRYRRKDGSYQLIRWTAICGRSINAQSEAVAADRPCTGKGTGQEIRGSVSYRA